MIDPRRQSFLPYVLKLAELMGVHRWRITIDDIEPETSNDEAAICVCKFRESASIRFADRFLDMKPEEQRELIVHELLHIHEADSMHLLDEFLSKKEYRLWRHRAELMVEHLARSIAPLFPLPSRADELRTTADHDASTNKTDLRS